MPKLGERFGTPAGKAPPARLLHGRQNLICVEKIPEELRALRRWAYWVEGPEGKVPKNPRTGGNAKCNDPGTWGTFAEACAALNQVDPTSKAGLNFALNGDGIIGVDLDNRRDPGKKAISEWARKIIGRLNSYTEISPSGRGIRIFLRGRLPPHGRHKGQIEVYDRNKFLSVTGRNLTFHGAGDAIQDRSAQLMAWHKEVFGVLYRPTKESKVEVVLNDPPELDEARLRGLFCAKPKAEEIFQGRRVGYDSQSEADLALANCAARAGWEAQEICDLLVAARTNAGEAIKPADYFQRTIAKALEGTNPAPRNGQPPSKLAETLKLLPSGTDEIAIGGDQGEETAEAGSMADVSLLIAGVKYLVREWVPFGMVTMLVGEPGAGKSAFALCALVGPIITRLEWFNGMIGPAEAGDVLWCDTEGTAAITVQRIKNWGLPAERIKVPFPDDPLLSVNLACDEHLARIEAVIGKHQIKLVVIDSLRGAHDGDENNSRVAAVLQQLAKIAERTQAAIVVIHHTRKLAPDEDITANASRGSNALVGMVRTQLGIDRPDPRSAFNRLRMLKENLGLKPKPVGFRIGDTGLEFGEAPQRPKKETQEGNAREWLKQNMEPGKWYWAAKLTKNAEDDGFAETALRRARNELGIVKPHNVKKTAKGWTWRRPE
jgi:hypothetical protein